MYNTIMAAAYILFFIKETPDSLRHDSKPFTVAYSTVAVSVAGYGYST